MNDQPPPAPAAPILQMKTRIKIKSKLKPKPRPKPLLSITNATHFCYDCEKLLTSDCEKGMGFGLIGINLYFCSKCYLDRFDKGEGVIINFSIGTSQNLRHHYYEEFIFYFKEKQDCFNCHSEEDLYVLHGFINRKILACKKCYHNLNQRLKKLSSEINKEDLTFISDEIKYHRKFLNQRIKEKFLNRSI